MKEYILLSRLRIVEAELCIYNLTSADSFLAMKKEFSHIIYCLKTIYEILRKEKTIEVWQNKNTDGKDPFEFIKQYRENDLHDGNHGFSLQYQLGFIHLNGGIIKFGKGVEITIKDLNGDIKFIPNTSGVATSEGLFLVDNEGQENETWRIFNPKNFPWAQNVKINLPGNLSINDFVLESINAYKKMLWEIETLIDTKA